MVKFSLVVTLLMFSCSLLLAQGTGQIYGTVTSTASGELLPGINVVLQGTTLGAATDLDGKYLIKNIPDGLYTIIVSGIGYSKKTIPGLKVNGSQKLQLNFSLTDESYNVNEVIVTADKIKSTEASLLAERKKSSEITDLISAEQIKRTPDATSGDALKRVTGINLVDNKFIYIRGITDRYNETTLDGSAVSTTEMGKKSFSYDLLPSNLLEYTSVVKSSSPDLPGNFTGGLVQLHTLDIPAERIFKLSYSSSYNTISTFKGFSFSQGSSSDWLGFDNGSRKLPAVSNDNQIGLVANNNWAPRTGNAPMNNALSLVYADRWDIGQSDMNTDQLGYVLALSYKNSYQVNNKVINDEVNSRYNTGSNYESNVLWGAIANFSLKLNGTNKINFKNNFNQSGVNNISEFLSEDNNTNLENRFTVINWTQRSSYSGNLGGEHVIEALNNLEIKYKAGITSSKRDDPDRKEITYYREYNSPDQPYTAAINQRSWSNLNDRAFTYGLDLLQPVADGKIKLGALYETRKSNYNIRYFNVIPDYQGGISDSLTQLPLTQIYSPENYGKGKFVIKESSKATDSYNGDQQLFSTYLMGDYPFSIFNQNFRLSGGVRMENSQQDVFVPKTLDQNGPVTSSNLQNTDFLPSANFTYLITDNINFRAAYSHSVNRPNFRELASTGFYDFIKYEMIGGNPNLKRALIKNFDLRFEVFPAVGELFAVSYFRKTITDAIEEVLFQSAVRTRSWFNSNNVNNQGYEIEFRKNLGFIHPWLTNFSVMANYTRVESAVSVEETSGNSSQTVVRKYTRQLQGQSPYIMNYSVWYTNPESGTTVNIMYNKFGRRLDAVGFQSSDIYEEPRDIIDLSISQDISKVIDLKLTVKNIAGKERVLTRDNKLYEKTGSGTTFSLQAGLNF